MANANETLGPGDRMILERLKDVKRPVYLLLNKVDLLKTNQISTEQFYPI